MGYDNEQLTNARLIISVGLEMGMSSRDITIGLMTAMQESSLRNLHGGMGSSLGLFQQTSGWGSSGQRTDPIWSTKKFFSSLSQVGNRDQMSMGQAAQAVQKSAYPTAYNQWESDARRLMNGAGQNGGLPFPVDRPTQDLSLQGALGGPQTGAEAATGATPGLSATTSDQASPAAPGSGATTGALQTPKVAPSVDTKAMDQMLNNLQGNGTGQRSTVVAAARKMLGTNYLWGGGDANGPTYGSAHGYTGVGLDCSGLVLYALAQAGIKGVAHFAASQLGMGKNVGQDWGQLQPGDLVGMEGGGHIGIYIGNGQMIESPHTGAQVRISDVKGRAGAWGVHLNLSGSYSGGGAASGTPAGLDIPMQQNAPVESYPGL